jgi:3-hydroxyisobutyrate dehydrogenase-like beta-hydroxyacid dehydrogenase
MAANLLKEAQALTVYNRTREKAEPLVARGAIFAKTPAEARPPSTARSTPVMPT